MVGTDGNLGSCHDVLDASPNSILLLILDADSIGGTDCIGAPLGRVACVSIIRLQQNKNMPNVVGCTNCLLNQALGSDARQISFLGIDMDASTRFQSDRIYK